jgi:hypothetical protein
MIIIIQGNHPFEKDTENKTETINEVVVLVVLYHMILISDFVPDNET